MWQILVREFNSYLNSLIAYVVIGIFITSIGLLMWVFPDTSVLEYGYADMTTLFSLGPFVFMFLIPAITMRTFAEEKRSGTLELLYTRPVSDWEIIIGKIISSWLLSAIAILLSSLYYFSLYQLSSPIGNIDSSGIAGSYIGFILLAGVFTSIGVLASSVTSSQIVAFVLAVFFSFILYSGLNSFSMLFSGEVQLWIEQLSLIHHYEAMSRGVIDIKNIVYLISVMVLVTTVTKTVLESRKW